MPRSGVDNLSGKSNRSARSPSASLSKSGSSWSTGEDVRSCTRDQDSIQALVSSHVTLIPRSASALVNPAATSGQAAITGPSTATTDAPAGTAAAIVSQPTATPPFRGG
jgi:hypothetical protein